MKAGRTLIGIFQKMRIKNLRGEGGQWGPIKKLDSFTLETSKNHLIPNFLRNGRVRVNPEFSSRDEVSCHINFKIQWNENISLM